MANFAETRDYLTYAEGTKREEVRREQDCMRFIFQKLTPVKAILEVFGGFGLMMELLESMKKVDKLEWRTAWEHSARCVAALREKWPNHDIVETDSFNTPLPRPDTGVRPFLVSADFNTFSPLKMVREEKYGRLVNGIFWLRPDWVHLTDSSPNKIHINAPHYSNFFGSPVTDVESYLITASEFYHGRYGYSIVRAAWHSNAAYYLLKRTKPGTFPVTRCR